MAEQAAENVRRVAERTPGIQEHSLEAVRLATKAMCEVAAQAAEDAQEGPR